MAALKPMADGLVKRFKDASQQPPWVLYTDRECCGVDNGSKYNHLFESWPNLIVRLDIYHFMRRFALAVTSESHPLYAVFMSRLASCIFEWEGADVKRLERAKREELKAAGIPNPSDSAVRKAITEVEMARHCKWRTRGVAATKEAINNLLSELSTSTDTLGVPQKSGLSGASSSATSPAYRTLQISDYTPRLERLRKAVSSSLFTDVRVAPLLWKATTYTWRVLFQVKGVKPVLTALT